MSKSHSSRQPAHFEELYQANPDPWGFTSSVYEQQKYAATLAALGGRRFSSAFEVGCSIGVLTERLVACCDRVLGVDFASAAVVAARAHCASHLQVRIEQMQVPQQWPAEQFDLILFSEVLYFFSESDLLEIADRTSRSLLPGGYVLLVNYTGVTDDPLSGDQAAALFMTAASPALVPIQQQRALHYRLDLLAART